MARASLLVVTITACNALKLPSNNFMGGELGSGAASRADVLRRAALAMGAALLPAQRAHADVASEGVTIGQIPGSGIIFKDIVKVERVEDQGGELMGRIDLVAAPSHA